MTWLVAIMPLLRKEIHDLDQRALNAGDAVGRNYGVDIEHRGGGTPVKYSRAAPSRPVEGDRAHGSPRIQARTAQE